MSGSSIIMRSTTSFSMCTISSDAKVLIFKSQVATMKICDLKMALICKLLLRKINSTQLGYPMAVARTKGGKDFLGFKSIRKLRSSWSEIPRSLSLLISVMRMALYTSSCTLERCVFLAYRSLYSFHSRALIS